MSYVLRNRSTRFLAGLADGVGYALAGGRKKTPKPVSKTNRRILIVRLDHWGDMVPATALPKILKEYFSNCEITFLTSSLGAVLLENNPFVDERVVYEAPWFFKARGQNPGSSLSWRELIRLLRARKFDLGVAPRGDLRENALLWLSGVRERVGYGITGGGFFLTKEVFYRKNAHESEATLDLLKEIGIQTGSLPARLYFADPETRAFEEKMRSWGLHPASRYVGFQWHSGTSSKNWEEAHIRTFLESFSDRFQKERLVIIGTSGKGIDGRWTNLVGRTTPRELCLLMRTFKVFVGPDSGPSHLASALGIPTVFLYSGTNAWERWKPLAEDAAVIRKEVPCAPCARNICNVQGHPCMSRITPGEVLDAVAKILELIR